MGLEVRIIVPLDGSAKDGRALAVAGALANLAGAGIHLVHVLDADASASARRDAEQRLTSTAHTLGAATHHPVDGEVLGATDIAEALIRHAAERGVLLVVMGTRAPSTMGLLVVGSIADRVMRECSKPVVLVPPGADYMAGKRVQFRRVLVPLDGSALAAQALDFLLRWPHAGELEYVLLEVVTSSGADVDIRKNDDEPPRRVVAANEQLQVAAERLRDRGITTVETYALEADDPAEGITAAVREYLVEIIAMSTRGTGGLRRMAFGSVAEDVVRTSEMPVLLLTPINLAELSRMPSTGP